MHTVREMLTPCLREILGSLKSEPDIRSSRCLVTSFFQHLSRSPDLTSAFGGQRSIQLSYGSLAKGARAFSVKTESPKMLYPFEFEPVLVRKPPTLFGNRR